MHLYISIFNGQTVNTDADCILATKCDRIRHTFNNVQKSTKLIVNLYVFALQR